VESSRRRRARSVALVATRAEVALAVDRVGLPVGEKCATLTRQRLLVPKDR
jgi:hypothetical protein